MIKFSDEFISTYDKMDRTVADTISQIYHYLVDLNHVSVGQMRIEELEKEYQVLDDSLSKLLVEYDSDLDFFHTIMADNGASQSQIAWDIYNNIRLPRKVKAEVKQALVVITTKAHAIQFFLALKNYVEYLAGKPFTDAFNYDRMPEKFNNTNLIKYYRSL